MSVGSGYVTLKNQQQRFATAGHAPHAPSMRPDRMHRPAHTTTRAAASRLGSPSTSLGRSEATLGSTATRTTGLQGARQTGGKGVRQGRQAGVGRGGRALPLAVGRASRRSAPAAAHSACRPTPRMLSRQPPKPGPCAGWLAHLTENFMALMVCASSLFSSHSVAFLVMNWSRPTSATVLPETRISSSRGVSH